MSFLVDDNIEPPQQPRHVKTRPFLRRRSDFMWLPAELLRDMQGGPVQEQGQEQ